MIGREKEQKELLRRYRGNQAEFIAVYGRRRVGKTFLIDETFREKITFRHAGLSPVEGNRSGQMKAQLEQFYYSLLKHGMKKSHLPQSWLEAFFMLEMVKDAPKRIKASGVVALPIWKMGFKTALGTTIWHRLKMIPTTQPNIIGLWAIPRSTGFSFISLPRKVSKMVTAKMLYSGIMSYITS